MSKRESSRPDGRIRERGSRQGGIERVRGDRSEREEFKSPKSKPSHPGNMCLYCGTVFRSRDEKATACPKCSIPF